MLLTQLWFININPTIYRLQQQPMHVCIFKYILLLPVLKLQPIGSPYSKLWRNSRRYTLLECWRLVQYFTKFNDLTFLPKTAYVLLLQNMNQCLTVAINSDLARLIRVKPRHVTVPWSYAEEGILTVTIKRRRKTQTLTDCIWFFLTSPPISTVMDGSVRASSDAAAGPPPYFRGWEISQLL